MSVLDFCILLVLGVAAIDAVAWLMPRSKAEARRMGVRR